MTQITTDHSEKNVRVENPAGSSSVVLVCEHAAHHIPAAFNGLGLSPTDLKSHAVWDPGAMAVARQLSKLLDARLIAARVSRLVYDCNRPPSAPDAMPAQSEVVEVPGNRGLTQADRDARADIYYHPFRTALRDLIAQLSDPIIITIHSFTPVYHGQQRSVEIGVLHDNDARLADALLETANAYTDAEVQRNQPYGPAHGVTHTLQEHGVKHGHLNVMLEIRNDLIETAAQQAKTARLIAAWIEDACARLNVPGAVTCRA